MVIINPVTETALRKNSGPPVRQERKIYQRDLGPNDFIPHFYLINLKQQSRAKHLLHRHLICFETVLRY